MRKPSIETGRDTPGIRRPKRLRAAVTSCSSGLRAVTPFQFLAHVAEAVDEAEFEPTRAAPEQAGKDGFVILQLAGAAFAHHGDEDLVDLELKGLQIFDVLLFFRLEGIEDDLIFAGRYRRGARRRSS